MAKSAKTFMKQLQEKCPEELLVVNEGPLKPHENECSAIVWQLKRIGRMPATIFTNLETISGKKWPGGGQWQQEGTYTRLAIACDLPPEKWNPEGVVNELAERLNHPVKSVAISEGEAPIKHTVVKEDKVSFWDLPLYRKDSKDARPAWICGLAIGKHPETGRYNLSWHRHHVHGPKRSGARLQYRHLWQYLKRHKELGQKEMPMAWIFGAHPLVMLGGAARPGYDVDEYDVIGGLLKEPFRLVPSATWGKDFMIPADAELVVEGYLHTTERDFNGPWVDYMRYYSPQTLEPAFRPTAFNYQENALVEQNWVGHNTLHGEVGYSITLTKDLKQKFPAVRVALRVQPYTAVVQFKPDHPGEAVRLAHHALIPMGDFIKNVIVVDEDINPYDLNDVLWAVGTRVNANSGQVQILQNLNANRHDPASMEDMLVGGILIDATKPAGKPFPEVGRPEEELIKRLAIDKILGKKVIDKIPQGGGSQITGMGI
jgi:2,5-furandicarboxylate decarboxylase 1